MDDNLGRIIDYLEKEDLLTNTLLVYMGDNGFQFGEHGLMYRKNGLSGFLRVPSQSRA
ncbi:sulfatase-like hydrolase/transferase [Bacteroidota bacterium]